ncbi:MAG: YwaF family protein [Treponema sp.]|nr:YwaF family protein [Treponema sp.]
MTDMVLSRALMALFIAGGAAYLPLACRAAKVPVRRREPYEAASLSFALRDTSSFRRLVFHGLFSLVLAAQGLSFLFYYPFNRFGFLAWMFSITAVYGGFILAYFFKSERQKETVILVHAALLFFLTVWKLLFFHDIPFEARLPLNVCNVLVLFVFTRYFFKSRILDNYIVCFGIIAGLVYFLIGSWFDDTSATGSFGHGFFYYRMFESVLLHNIFFSYCVYAIVTRYIVVDVKKAMANMIWIIPYFFVFGFINQIWKTDYFFTGVYGVTPPFLVGIYYSMPFRFTVSLNGFPFDINPLHGAFILCSAGTVLFIVSSAISAIQRITIEIPGHSQNVREFREGECPERT